MYWDTAGQDRFASIVNAYLRGAQAMVITFNLCSKASYDKVYSYVRKADENKISPIFLVGTHLDSDMLREVSTLEAQV